MDEGGVEALFELSRRKLNLMNRVDPKIELSVEVYAIEFPVHGQARISNELRELSVAVTPSVSAVSGFATG